MLDNFRLSVSKAKTFKACKKQYKFNYILKLASVEQPWHTFGKWAHFILQKFHDEIINGSQLPFNKIMSMVWKESLKEFGEKITPEMKKECWVIINEYLKQISRRTQQANVLACEKPFEILIHNDDVVVCLNGVIDRIQLDEDNIIHVLDYKSTKKKQFLENDWFQLLVYAYVILKEDPSVTKVRTSYILLRHNFEYMTKEFNVNEIMEVEEKLVSYAKEIIAEKKFDANPTNMCAFCSYLQNCQEGRKQIYKNQNGEISW